MRIRRTDTPRQLALFDLPAVRTRGRGPAHARRMLAAVLAVGAATATIMGGSYAAWFAQTANPANSVATGTLSMTNSKSAATVFTTPFTNVKPGDTGSNTVTVTNSGSLPMSVKLTQDTITTTGLEASLGLKIHDDTRNWCYWPATGSGGCATYGTWDASATVSSLALPATSGAAQWPAAQAHTFTISWQLGASSPNGDQGKTASFRLVWDGTQ